MTSTVVMQEIIDRHMQAAFDEIQATLGETPKHVQLCIMESCEHGSNEFEGAQYQGCKVSTMSRQPNGLQSHTLA